ncbi:right-handed parallel beta-helix repeat-containing protein [Sutcliffiella horikoshii]|uniref:right-handed parallel beta-helix repeat-containing protein n=1 Tax=Sutcliffiella horikoshii TaxID=79883 RepID=UPI001CBA8FD9|nr:right-handed parallel beta-helix repeat-containing protein [Sutcliffiella horikoshii]UAL46928.1 right-handed parallel beta-helix repeat-containing protein [Sutcliffiella horikoshii]
MSYKIQIRSSLKGDLPFLDIGEFCLCTDTKELFIGIDNGNLKVANIEDIGSLNDLPTLDKSSLVSAFQEIFEKIHLIENLEITSSNINGNVRVNGKEIPIYDDSYLLQALIKKATKEHTHNIQEITGISISNPIDGEVLMYDSTENSFKSKTLPNFQAGSLEDLTNVNTITSKPKTGDVLSFNGNEWFPTAIKSYYIDLDLWTINNKGDDPLRTTIGINNALQWANANGYSRCKLPPGLYLIDRDSTIQLVNDMTLDLYGCILKKETNSYQKYTIVNIENKKNVTIVGGVIEGDKNTHDYISIPGTHEWGTGINVSYSKNIKIENVEIKETTGYGISVGSKYLHNYWVYLSELESGTFDLLGNPVSNEFWVRSNKYYSLSHETIQKQGYFMICGNGYGAYGEGQDLTKDMVTVFLYDKENNFLGKQTRRTFECFYLKNFPSGAIKFKISYRKVFTNIIDSTITIRSDAFSQGVNITNCFIHNCRTLGIVGGGQFINIEHCEIANIGGASPGYGIDIEDGYNLNQNIVIRSNYFHDNKNGDIVVISARNVLVEMNKFNGTVSFGGSRGESYVSQYNSYNGAQGTGSSLAGGGGSHIVFNYDHFTETTIYILGNPLYTHCTFDNVSFILQSDLYLLSTFTYCKFNFNKRDEGWSWNLRKGSLVFDSCEFHIYCKWYYFRSEAHLGDWVKNKLIFRNNFFYTRVNLGESVYEVNELILENNTFLGTQDKLNYFGFWAKANLFKFVNNTVKDVYFKIDGKGDDSKAIISNNSVVIDKDISVQGPDRSEFLRISNFKLSLIKDNDISILKANAQIRCISVYAENELVMLRNNFNCNLGSNAKVELFGTSDSSLSNNLPELIAIIKDNILKNVSITAYNSFNTQLTQPIIGTNLTVNNNL